MLSLRQVEDVCYAGDYWDYNKVCRYLKHDHVNNKYIYTCTKLATAEYKKLDATHQRGTASLAPKGDNCPGYLYLKHKEQGYDV